MSQYILTLTYVAYTDQDSISFRSYSKVFKFLEVKSELRRVSAYAAHPHQFTFMGLYSSI